MLTLYFPPSCASGLLASALVYLWLWLLSVSVLEVLESALIWDPDPVYELSNLIPSRLSAGLNATLVSVAFVFAWFSDPEALGSAFFWSCDPIYKNEAT